MPESVTRPEAVEKRVAVVQRRYAEYRRDHAEDIEQGQFMHLPLKSWVEDTEFLLKLIADEGLHPSGAWAARRIKDIGRRAADLKNRHSRAIKENLLLPLPIKDVVEETELLLAVVTGGLVEEPGDNDDSDEAP